MRQFTRYMDAESEADLAAGDLGETHLVVERNPADRHNEVGRFGVLWVMTPTELEASGWDHDDYVVQYENIQSSGPTCTCPTAAVIRCHDYGCPVTGHYVPKRT